MKDGRAAEKLAAETRLLFGGLLNGDFMWFLVAIHDMLGGYAIGEKSDG